MRRTIDTLFGTRYRKRHGIDFITRGGGDRRLVGFRQAKRLGELPQPSSAAAVQSCAVINAGAGHCHFVSKTRRSVEQRLHDFMQNPWLEMLVAPANRQHQRCRFVRIG